MLIKINQKGVKKMKRIRIGLVLCIIAALIMTLTVGCQTTTPATEITTTTEAAVTTTTTATTGATEVETTEAKPNFEDLDFEDFMEMANNREYPGKPGEDKTIGFANLVTGNPFVEAVQNGFVEEAKLAGFAEENIYILDNRRDSTVGLKNADIMLSKNPDVFVEFQIDSKVNNIISKKFKDAGIPLIAVDIPIPGAPFIGVDNWGVSVMNGEYAIKLVEEQWGGIDNVDLILVFQDPQAGEVTMLRTEGFAQAFRDKYGEKAEEKIVYEPGGVGQADAAQKVCLNLLAAYPDAEKIVFTCLNGPATVGIISAFETLGRFNPDNIIHISNGGDASERELLRAGKTDGCIAYFPEFYGRKIIPTALSLIYGKYTPLSDRTHL